MNNRQPGENFKDEAKQFVDNIKNLAALNYQKLVTLGHHLGQKLQKTFNPTPGPGGTSSGTKTRVIQNPEDEDRKD